MENLYQNLLIFFSYGAIVAGFIDFNNTYPKKYIDYISKGHICTLITIFLNFLCILLKDNSFLLSIKAIGFIIGYLFITLAILEINKLKKPKGSWIFVVAVLLIDVIACMLGEKDISIFIHKAVFITISIAIATYVFKQDTKRMANNIIGIAILAFAILQVSHGFLELGFNMSIIYEDEGIYLAQLMLFSQVVMITAVNEDKMQYNNKLLGLQNEVNLNMKKLVEAYEKNKVEADFMTNISHEIRTPVNILYSSLQLFEIKIKQREIDKESVINEYTEIMKKNCSRLIKLVNNLIDSSKIESGFIKIRLRNYEIVSIIEDITLSAVAYAERKNIELIFDTKFEELNIVCDKEKIERIMLNLLSNAIKYTDDGGKIQVFLDKNQDEIIVSVEDNGVGISKNMQEQVFARFSQGDNCKRDIEGSGIGLSLTKAMVEMHGGRIWVESIEWEGSKFSFSIPIIESEETNVSDSKEIDSQKLDIELSDIYLDNNFLKSNNR
ncbi:sensor histidine kinase [Clostridium cellulovorans]|uniref:histidine kinase n=1 Tax=Clostridium cellulovorans (strain ATCC 35296 / DSM 3052 / OCM 3 / 743B) TaxID=573061 RepID=D9SL02_CLOC7|nr:HAMP domain-containing sensor histidine kinase [Clostridium cellulovorans]ADL53574.1 integral membrane sensor signal transduction histidine kinase [Clostridium cellulovorans 743B]